MDDLERYFARRARRQKFVLNVRDAADPDRSARLQFERLAGMPPLVPGAPPRLALFVNGMGLVDFEDDLARAGWTKASPGYSDERSQLSSWRRPPPPDELPATLAGIVRAAVKALLGTAQYALTIEPFRGFSRSEIGEAAGYRYLLWIGCFLVAAPAVLVAALVTGSSVVELVLIVGALVAVAALYPVWTGPFADAVVTFEVGLEESALLERPFGRTLIHLVTVALAFAGLWLPVAIMVVIRWAF